MRLFLGILLMLAAPLVLAAPLDIGGILSLVIYLVVIGLIFSVIWWFIGYVGVPEPFNKVVRVVVGLLALIIVIGILLQLAGTPVFR